jgi:glutathione S-transferase
LILPVLLNEKSKFGIFIADIVCKAIYITFFSAAFLTAIEGAMASGITLLLMKRSGMNIEENFMFTARQKDRIESVLDYLKPSFNDKALKEWNFASMTTFSFLDWATFRNIVSLEKRPECRKFLDQHAHRPDVVATIIPKV